MRARIAGLIGLLFSSGCDDSGMALSVGDQKVFAGIGVRIDSYQYDTPNYGGQAGPPPLESRRSVYVTINQGTEAGRISGLRITASGAEIPEVGSAGLPQQFSYQYDLRPAGEESVTLSFEYRDSRFQLVVPGVAAEITAPAKEAELSASAPVPIRWSGPQGSSPEVGAEMSHYSASGTGACNVAYRTAVTGAGEALASPERRAQGSGPPCSGEVRAVWSRESSPESPFSSLLVRQKRERLQRFHIR